MNDLQMKVREHLSQALVISISHQIPNNLAMIFPQPVPNVILFTVINTLFSLSEVHSKSQNSYTSYNSADIVNHNQTSHALNKLAQSELLQRSMPAFQNTYFLQFYLVILLWNFIKLALYTVILIFVSNYVVLLCELWLWRNSRFLEIVNNK